MVHISERTKQIPELFVDYIERFPKSKNFISLGAGQPDFPTPKPIVDFVKKSASKASRYAPLEGIEELREALAKKLRNENKIKNANPENINVTCGSQEAFFLAVLSTVDVSEEMIIPSPGYMEYLPALELATANPIFLQLRENEGWDPNPDEIKKLITPKTVGLVINDPANPTGNVIPKKILEEIADIAIEHDIYIFSDEAYEQIIYDGAQHISPASLNGMEKYVVTFGTFSKTYSMCGYRVGYVLAPEKLSKIIANSHVITSIAAPTISQFAALKALSISKDYIRRMVQEYDKRRKMIVERLNEMGLATHMPKGAFYTFTNIQGFSNNSRNFAEALLKKKQVAVIPGSEFGRFGEGYIRCSYATEYKDIEEALDRVQNFLTKL